MRLIAALAFVGLLAGCDQAPDTADPSGAALANTAAKQDGYCPASTVVGVECPVGSPQSLDGTATDAIWTNFIVQCQTADGHPQLACSLDKTPPYNIVGLHFYCGVCL